MKALSSEGRRYGDHMHASCLCSLDPGRRILDDQAFGRGDLQLLSHQTIDLGIGLAVLHVIARGDTLSEIAERYNVSTAAIRAANKLSNDSIRVGQTLSIPLYAGT